MCSERDRSVTLSVSLPLSLVEKLDKNARRLECPRSHVLSKILEDYFELTPEESRELGADCEKPRLRRALRVLRDAALSP